MNIFQMAIDRYASRQGYIRPELAAARFLPDDTRHDFIRGLESMYSKDLMMDPVQRSKAEANLHQTLDASFGHMRPVDQHKAISIMQGGLIGVGYEPQGSVLRKIYPNLFGVYAFVGDNYWVCRRARHRVRVGVKRDGFIFQGDGASKKKVRLVYDTLKQLGLLGKIDEIVDQLNLYGNSWLRPVKNLLGGVIFYEVLQPEMMRILWNPDRTHVIGWEYKCDGVPLRFNVGDLVHLKTFSSRTQDMGSPSLASIIVAIEACMYADLYTSTLFQKGGLIGNVISMKIDKVSQELIAQNNWSLLAEETQKRWDKQLAGVKGAGQTIISPFVDKIHKLSEPKDVEGPLQWFAQRTDMKAAQLLCVAPEMVGIPITSQYQDKGMTADRIGESFDDDKAYLADIAYGFCNQVIREELGIDNLVITAGTAYKTRALAAAQYGLALAQIGDVITVDEYRVQVLHMEPFGGELGGAMMRMSGTAVAGVESPTKPQGPPLMSHHVTMMKGWTIHTEEEILRYPTYR